MVNVCVSVPEDMKRRLEKHETVNWSAVARNAFAEELEKLELMNKLTARSKATEKDVRALSKKIKKGIRDWHDRMG